MGRPISEKIKDTFYVYVNGHAYPYCLEDIMVGGDHELLKNKKSQAMCGHNTVWAYYVFGDFSEAQTELTCDICKMAIEMQKSHD